MAEGSALSIAFIERRPLAAARALSSVSPEDAASFLQTVPSRIAVLAFVNMGAWQSFPILMRMEIPKAAAILRELNYSEAAAVLRLVVPEIRTQLLDALPEKLRRDFRNSLSFPDDTVGAHMNILVLTLKRHDRIQEALDHVKKHKGAEINQIFVVDDRGRPVGVVDCGMLLRHPTKTLLGEIMDEDLAVLSARSRIATVVDLDSWDDHTHLPVISRQKQIIGVLSRKAARVALMRRRADQARPQDSMLSGFGRAFYASTVGLLQLFTAHGPESGRVPQERGGR